MTTLVDYTRTQFPQHEVDAGATDAQSHRELTDHTVVAHVVGRDVGTLLGTRLQNFGAPAPVAWVVVRPRPARVVPRGPEDKDGIFDLPRRRIVVGIVLGAVIGAALFAGLCVLIGTPGTVVAVLAVFGGVLGGGLGFLFSGGGRYAGDRAWTQPQVEGEAVTVVGVFVEDEADAAALAAAVDTEESVTVRIVDRAGRWRVPND